MKCCKCNFEIPDGSKFCMECGAEQGVLRKCPLCGTEGLPLEAKFCPNCGSSIHDEDLQKSSIEMFFPVFGITLGKTKTTDNINPQDRSLRAKYDKDENVSYSEVRVTSEDRNLDFSFYQHDSERFISLMTDGCRIGYMIPKEWRKFHFSEKKSFHQWRDLFEALDFDVEEYDGYVTDSLDCMILRAISPDKLLVFRLDFHWDDHYSFDFDERGKLTRFCVYLAGSEHQWENDFYV